MRLSPHIVVLSLLTVAFLGAFWGIPGPVRTLRRRAGGALQADLRLAYGPDILYRLLDAYGQAGRRLFRHTLYADMIFPALYAATLGAYGGALAPHAQAATIKFAAAAALFDYGENGFLLAVLRKYPARSRLLARLAGLCTTAKMLALATALVLLMPWTSS